jgi:IMP cyclohydrolase
MQQTIFNNKAYQIPERMGMLPARVVKQIKVLDYENDPDVDFKQLALILNETEEFVGNIPNDEYLKLVDDVYKILLKDINPELLQSIYVDKVNESK